MRLSHTLIPFFALTFAPSFALAYGEAINGFPNWAERVMHAWTNRARVDPQVEMQACGAPCGEAACYTPKDPIPWNEKLNHAARFHSANMQKMNFFSHTSKCTIVPNIDALYPATCDGSASCACVGGTAACSPTCTGFFERVGLFGVQPSGEIIASPSDPNSAFYLWLFEPTANTTCQFTQENGHRLLLLTGGPAVGFGLAGDAVGDFGGNGGNQKLPSGSHYPQQAASVEAWTNWIDAAPPSLATVNVDGTCIPMSLGRGKPENGAYMANVTGVGSGCHRYYFHFKDANGQKVTYPDTGSLGIGKAGCADWDATRPPEGAGCDCAPSCNGAQCGDNGCGGTCGTCQNGEVCQGGMCVADPGTGSGGAGGAGSGSSSSSSGSVGSSSSSGSMGAGGNADNGGGDEEGSCGCRAVGSASNSAAAGLGLLLAAAALASRQRRRSKT